MSLQTLAPVHATHDIRRGREVVKRGWHGRVVDSFPNWSTTTYSVQFTADGDPSMVLTISGLTERDVQADGRQPRRRSVPGGQLAGNPPASVECAEPDLRPG